MEKPIFSNKDLFKLIWPLMVEQTLNVFVGMVDVLMVAVLGESAVSGVSLVDSINILLIQVLSALATGGAVVCSKYIGARQPEKARRSAGQLVFLTITFALLVMLICLVGNRHLLKLIFGHTEADVMANAILYFGVTALSYPFLALYNSGAALFRAMGNSRISMIVSLIMNAVNVAGNALCIFGLHMGVLGVALPTLFARILAAVLIMIRLCSKSNPLGLTSLKALMPHKQMIRDIMSIGIPSGMENGMFQFGKLMLTSLVSTLGTASIAGFAVAYNLVTFLYLPGNTLGLVLLTIVGHCIGAGAIDQAKKYTWKLILLNYMFLAVLCCILGFGRGFFCGLYHLSPEADFYARGLVLIHSIAMIIWPPAFLVPYTLRAGFDARFTMIVSIAVMWIFRVGGAYLLIRGFHMNVLGIWYAMFADWVVRIIIYIIRLKGFTQRASLNIET